MNNEKQFTAEGAEDVGTRCPCPSVRTKNCYRRHNLLVAQASRLHLKTAGGTPALQRRHTMKNKMYGLGISVILSLVLLTPSLLLAGDNAAKPSKEQVVQKAQNLHVPFIANEGQVDALVRYYAKTFSGTVYVTRDGEIMYALPKYEETAKEDRNGRREQGGRGAEGQRGERQGCEGDY